MVRGRKFVLDVLSPAIRGETCPICLQVLEVCSAAVLTKCMHAYCLRCVRKWSNLKRTCPLCNVHFESWFSRINISSRSFHKERLPTLNRVDNLNTGAGFSRRDDRRVIRSTRNRLSRDRRLERPLSRRSFGPPASEPADVARRTLQWRKRIYERGIKAVPAHVRSITELSMSDSHGAKARALLQKIEPWIHRELHAILDDPNPLIIVHVATTIFMESHTVPSSQLNWVDDFLSPLRPFLHDKTDLFWHELRQSIFYGNI